MAVLFERLDQLGPAPALLVYRGDPAQAAGRGTILFYHGLGAAKEANLVELRSLAEIGVLAVGIDNVGHGQRRFDDFERRFAGPSTMSELLSAVKQTVDEVPDVIDALIQRFGGRLRFGIAGISMGGFIAYGALLADRRLAVATPILGSPRWWSDAGSSPHRQPEQFYPRAILSQNAGRDCNVPASAARDFHAALAPYYRERPQRQAYVEFPDSEHFMRPEDWSQLWTNTRAWFERYLIAPVK